MTKTIRATLAAAGVAVLGLAVLAVIVGAVRFHERSDYTAWPAQERIELMPPNSKEYAERHFVGPDGKDLKTEIQYRNGDHGVKLYRKDNTLAEWTIEFAAGGTRLHAVYAEDGKQVILGEQFRADRTMLWKATNKGGVVTLTEYYYDGTAPFSVVARKVGDNVQDAHYYRKDGTPWLRQVADINQQGSPTLEQVWDSTGKLTYERRTIDKDGKTTIVTYYRPDGTAAFKQTWVEHQTTSSYGYQYGGWDGDYSYTTTTTSLQLVEEYGVDGTTVARRIRQDDDGTKVVSVEVIAADGTSTTYTADATDGKKMPEVSSDLLKALPTPPNPKAYWKDQETDESKRGEPAP